MTHAESLQFMLRRGGSHIEELFLMNSCIPSASRNVSRLGDGTTWVAQESETIVGWISAAGSRDADAGASTGEIWAVYVAPGHWGRGIGSSLCEIAERYLHLEGFVEV